MDSSPKRKFKGFLSTWNAWSASHVGSKVFTKVILKYIFPDI